MASCQRENLRDAFGDLPGGTVLAGIPNENRHLRRLLHQRGSFGQTASPGRRSLPGMVPAGVRVTPRAVVGNPVFAVR